MRTALLVLIPALLGLGAGSVALFANNIVVSILLGVATLALLVALVIVVIRLPLLLTRQGVRVDRDGLRLFASPRWWFGGWLASIPWSQVREVRSARPFGTGGGTIAISLRHEPDSRGRPVWVSITPPGAAPGNGDQISDDYRLYLQLPKLDLDRIQRAIDQRRAEVRPEARPEPPTPIAEQWISIRLESAVLWGCGVLLAIFLTQVPLWSYLTSDTRQAWPDPILLVLIVLAGLGAGMLIFLMPASLARQGVAIGPTGLEIRRYPMWWGRGCRLALPTSDIRVLSEPFHDPGPFGETGKVGETGFFARHQRPSVLGRRPASGVELVLNRMPDAPVLPRWAKIVPSGVEARHVVTDWPRLMIKTGNPQYAERIRHLLSRIMPAGAENDEADLVRTIQWVPVPRRGLVWRFIVAIALGILGGSWLAQAPLLTAGVPTWSQALWPGAPLMLIGLVTWLVVWQLPARLARSGIQIEPAGMQLIREPFLWRRGRRARVSWDQVQDIRATTVASFANLRYSGGTERSVVLDLAGPVVGQRPHWARARRHGAGLQIFAGDQFADRVVRLAQEARRANQD